MPQHLPRIPQILILSTNTLNFSLNLFLSTTSTTDSHSIYKHSQLFSQLIFEYHEYHRFSFYLQTVSTFLSIYFWVPRIPQILIISTNTLNFSLNLYLSTTNTTDSHSIYKHSAFLSIYFWVPRIPQILILSTNSLNFSLNLFLSTTSTTDSHSTYKQSQLFSQFIFEYHEYHRFSFCLQTVSTFLSIYFWVPRVPQILILSTNSLNFSLNLFFSTTSTTDSHSIYKHSQLFSQLIFEYHEYHRISFCLQTVSTFLSIYFLSTTSTTDSHSVYKQSQLFSQFIFEYHEYHRFSFYLQTLSTFLPTYFWVPRVPQNLILSTNSLNFSLNLFLSTTSTTDSHSVYKQSQLFSQFIFEYHEYHRFSFYLQTLSTFLPTYFWVPRIPQILILSTNTLNFSLNLFFSTTSTTDSHSIYKHSQLFSQLIFEYHEYHRISFCLQTVSTFLSIYFWVPRVPQILILSTNSLNFSLNLFLSTTSTTDSHSIYKHSQLFSQLIFEYHEYHRISFCLQTVSTFLSIYFWVPRVPQILILSTNSLNFSLNLFLSTTSTTDSHSIYKHSQLFSQLIFEYHEYHRFSFYLQTLSTFLSIYFLVPRVPQILILSTNTLNFSPNLFLSTTSTTESHSVYKQSQLFSQFIFEYHEYHRFSFCLQTVSTFLSIYFWVPRVPQILILSTNTLNFSPNLFLSTTSTTESHSVYKQSQLFSQFIFEYHEYHRFSFCLQTVSTFLSIYFWVPRVPQILILSTNTLNFSPNLFLSTTNTTDSHSIYKHSQLFSQLIFEYHEYHRFSFYLQTLSTFLSTYFWVPRVPQILILSTNSLNFSLNLFLSTTNTTDSHSIYKHSQLFSQLIFEYHEYHRFSFYLQTLSTFLSTYFWVPRVPQILILSTNSLNFSLNLFLSTTNTTDSHSIYKHKK